MPLLTDMADVQRVLEQTRSIAVLGATSIERRAGFYVGEYLDEVGYEVWPVNPQRLGERIWGRDVLATLADLPGPVDMIDVFRRPDQLPAHVDEILDLPWKPACVWFQLGIRHDGAAARLSEAGIEVVQSRCTYADHRRLGIPSRAGR